MPGSSGSFLRNFIRNPHGTGAVAPATRTLAECVGRVAFETYTRQCAQSGTDLPVLELGAGTGALTQSLARIRPVLVEKDPAWAALLRLRFPELEIRAECASDTLAALDRPAGVVSSIPLLNNPQASVLKDLFSAAHARGLLRFCVLYTYGWGNPLAGTGFRTARRAAFVSRSLPPAHVWVYE